MQSSEGQFD
nr:unnamed protein product [Callosobruchus chinensis]